MGFAALGWSLMLFLGPGASVVHAHGETLLAIVALGGGAINLMTVGVFFLIRGERREKTRVVAVYLACLVLGAVLILSAMGWSAGDKFRQQITTIGGWIYLGNMLLGLPVGITWIVVRRPQGAK